MQLKGTLTIINYKTKSFKNKNGESVEYAEVAFHDNEGNKLTASVPKSSEIAIDLEKDSNSTEYVTGEATFEVTAQNKNGNNYPKLKLVSFKV